MGAALPFLDRRAEPRRPIERASAFGRLLRALRVRAGLSQQALATAAAIDAGYVNRLERAETTVPSRAVVCRLWLAVSDGPERAGESKDDELDELLATAGLLPAAVVRAGGWALYVRGWSGQVRTLEHKLDLSIAEIRRQATELVALGTAIREARDARLR